MSRLYVSIRLSYWLFVCTARRAQQRGSGAHRKIFGLRNRRPSGLVLFQQQSHAECGRHRGQQQDRACWSLLAAGLSVQRSQRSTAVGAYSDEVLIGIINRPAAAGLDLQQPTQQSLFVADSKTVKKLVC